MNLACSSASSRRGLERRAGSRKDRRLRGIEAVAAQDVRVIAWAMDVVGQRRRYTYLEPPHSVVLQHLLERIDDCSESLGEYPLVIADEVDGQSLAATASRARRRRR